MDGSLVFARWRQCAPHLIHASLSPPESKSQTASRSVQPFLRSSRQSVPISLLYNGPPFPLLKIAPFHGGSELPSSTWSLGSPVSSIQTASRSVQPFCRSLSGLDRPTDRPCYSVCNNIGRIHVRSTTRGLKSTGCRTLYRSK